MRIYFSLTLFLSAVLLFLIQPMVAKMTLPSLGGTPAVWNTCMVFFQAALLLGYLYAHALPKWLGVRWHAALHMVVLAVPLLVLPISLAGWGTPPADANPIPWLLTMLAGTVGLPFFVVATSAPLLQRWFSETGHPAARDPYFLYAASNIGSMVALLGYPFLVEPQLRVVDQSWVWLAGYALLTALIAGCALCVWRRSQQALVVELETPKGSEAGGVYGDTLEDSQLPGHHAQLTLGRRLRWIALSFVPSSLLLGFTTYLTTDIAAVPLLWVVPLAVYLLTFVLVFASKPPLPHGLMVRLLPLVVLAMLFFLLAGATGAFWLVVPVHFLGFFIVSMVCHGELAKDRPAAEHLTEFYLLMSVGGVLGGIFNALLAPLLFDTVAEYPLALVLACLLLPRSRNAEDQSAWSWSDLKAPAIMGLLGLGAMLVLREVGTEPDSAYKGPPPFVLVLAAMIVLCLLMVRRPVRFGLCVGAVVLVRMLGPDLGERVLYVERSFFGVHRVLVDSEARYHFLLHGTTRHGTQSLDPARRDEPLSYFHRHGPLGQTFSALVEMNKAPDVAVIGLGSGSITSYLETGQRLTYYEIDASVLRIANNPDYFTFLGSTRGEVGTVLGDGRLTLAAADRQFGLIILDAFSSDAIPLHLVTREALAMYVSKLSEDGVLVFHISNRYLNLEPVLGDLAAEAGLTCRAQLESLVEIPAEELRGGRLPSHYVVMARDKKHLGSLATDLRWRIVEPRPSARVWTDDYSNIISVWKW